MEAQLSKATIPTKINRNPTKATIMEAMASGLVRVVSIGSSGLVLLPSIPILLVMREAMCSIFRADFDGWAVGVAFGAGVRWTGGVGADLESTSVALDGRLCVATVEVLEGDGSCRATSASSGFGDSLALPMRSI